MESEGGPVVFLGVQADVAAVVDHDGADDGQSQPGAGDGPPGALEARKNRVNSSFWSCSGMPMPVSVTVRAAEPSSSAAATSMRPPSGVNLTALDSRLTSTRSSWPGVTRRRSGRRWAVAGQGQPARSTEGRTASAAAGDDLGHVSPAASPCVNAPDSSLDKVNTSSIRCCSRTALRSTASSIWRCSAVTGPASLVREHLQVPLDAGQRGTQFMGDGGEEVRLGLVHRLEVLDQAVLRLIQPGVDAAPGRYPPRSTPPRPPRPRSTGGPPPHDAPRQTPASPHPHRTA